MSQADSKHLGYKLMVKVYCKNKIKMYGIKKGKIFCD